MSKRCVGCLNPTLYGLAFCSDLCKQENFAQSWLLQNTGKFKGVIKKHCLVCEKLITTPFHYFYCSSTCSGKAQRAHPVTKAKERYKERCKKRGVIPRCIDPVTIAGLVARDGTSCYLCKQPMDMTLRTPHPKAPTIEHVKSVSKGGAHSWKNCKLAHRDCNIEKA